MKLLLIKKHKFSLYYILTFILFGLIFFHRFLIESGLPSSTKYFLDVLNIILFMFATSRKSKQNRTFKYTLLCYSAILIWGTGMFLANFFIWDTGFSSYIFDCRLLLRCPMFMYSCYCLLKSEDIERLFDWFLRFHILNSIYIVYQYFTLDVPIYWMRGDNLNGFFGTATGGNIYVNVLLLITTCIVINRYLQDTYTKKKLGIYLLLNLIIAALIELKIFFVELPSVIFIYAIPYMKRPTKKHLRLAAMLLFLSIPAYIGLTDLLYKLYPWMQGSLSMSSLIKLASSSEGYTGSGDINRLTAIQDVVRLIYNGDLISSLFGVGLGTANINDETAMFVSRFADTHYSWLSTSYYYVEVGIIGLVAYFASNLLPMLYVRKESDYAWMVRVICIMTIFLLFYNESMKTEASYMIAFLMSVNMIYSKGKKKTEALQGDGKFNIT